MQQERLQLIPIKVYIGKYGKIKIQLWLAKRLRKIMKKQVKKEKDQARQMDRSIKQLWL
jgi:tmRNA-binding protein